MNCEDGRRADGHIAYAEPVWSTSRHFNGTVLDVKVGQSLHDLAGWARVIRHEVGLSQGHHVHLRLQVVVAFDHVDESKRYTWVTVSGDKTLFCKALSCILSR